MSSNNGYPVKIYDANRIFLDGVAYTEMKFEKDTFYCCCVQKTVAFS